MDREAWRAAIHGVTKNRTGKNLVFQVPGEPFQREHSGTIFFFFCSNQNILALQKPQLSLIVNYSKYFGKIKQGTFYCVKRIKILKIISYGIHNEKNDIFRILTLCL